MECIRYLVMDNWRYIVYIYSCKCIHLKRVQVYTGECTLPSPRYRVDLVVECIYILVLEVLFTRARLYYIHLYTLVHVYTPCSVYTLHTVYFYIVQCTLYNVPSKMYSYTCTIVINGHCPQWTSRVVYCYNVEVYIVHCTMYTVQCIVYNVLCTTHFELCRLQVVICCEARILNILLETISFLLQLYHNRCRYMLSLLNDIICNGWINTNI